MKHFVFLALFLVSAAGCGPRQEASTSTVAEASSDLVAWIRSFGIHIHTYAVLDETSNPGYALPRRPDNGGVKAIREDLLGQFGTTATPFPPERLPNLAEVVEGMRKIPEKYLHILGQSGYALEFIGLDGHLAKNWSMTANGWTGGLTIRPKHVACLGGGSACPQFDGEINLNVNPQGVDQHTANEPVVILAYDGTNITFYRPNVHQTFTGWVQADGSHMFGTFTDGSPGTYDWSTEQNLGWGGSTVSYKNDSTVEAYGSPQRYINLALGSDAMTVTHEMGHAIDGLIYDQFPPFTAAQRSARVAAGFAQDTGLCDKYNRGDYTRPAGYITSYAPCSDMEDFAETWANILWNGQDVVTAVKADQAAGDQRLAAKGRFFYQQLFGWPPAF